MKRKFLLLLLIAGLYNAQIHEPCGFDKHQRELEAKNPEIKKAREASEARVMAMDIQKYVKSLGINLETGKNTVYEIPVVVHILQAPGSTTTSSNSINNITDSQIQAWINKANDIYACIPGTVGNGSPIYNAGTGLGFGTVMPFKLVLAKRDQNCNPTTGIYRYDASSLSGYGNYGIKDSGSAGITTTQMRTLAPHWNEKAYYNIYLVNTFDGDQTLFGLMGWAAMPTNPDNVFETVMKIAVVTKNDTTLAHEFAHSLGINHPFEGSNTQPNSATTTDCPPSTGNCLADNDKICDTEPTACLLNVSPVPTNSDTNPCSNAPYQDIQYNFMNYGISANKKFTIGQRDYALATFVPLRGSLFTSLGATAPGTGGGGTLIASTCNPVNPSSAFNYQGGPTRVIVGGLNNSSSAAEASNPKHYEDFTQYNCILPTVYTSLVDNATTPIQVEIKGSNNQNIAVYIDYNNNGTLESGELAASQIGVAPNTTWNGTLPIPPSTTVKNAFLRLRVIASIDNLTNACPTFSTAAFGQAEDYSVKYTNTLEASDSVSSTNTSIIYPNPFNDYLNIKDISKVKSISISDTSGRLLKHFSNPSSQINVSGFKMGMYIVTIYFTDRRIQTQKMIKK